MKARSLTVALSLLALAAMPVFSQDKPKPPEPAAASDPTTEAFTKAMTPGEQHKHLARRAGDWTFINKMWLDPGQPPAESTGKMHGEVLMDGRYVQTLWKGTMMGLAFEGRELDGYDNIAKEYVSSWVDNFGTGITYSTGSCEDDGKKCSMAGEVMNAVTGKKTTTRTVVTWTDDNNFKVEMYGADPTGKDYKLMELAVTKKKK